MQHFASDHTAGLHPDAPEVPTAPTALIGAQPAGPTPAGGGAAWTTPLRGIARERFDSASEVCLVSNGRAGNCVAPALP